jgi:hypothetical protein
MPSMRRCSQFKGMRLASRYSRTRACKVSQLGTHPISPLLGERGPLSAAARSRASNAFTSPNSCMTRSSCLRSSCPLSKNTYSAPSEPCTVSLRGRCFDAMTCTVGAKAEMVTKGSPAM